MKVIWSRESLKRLLEIENFIAIDNIEKAETFTDFLITKSYLIEENPKIGRMVPEFSDPDLRELILKGYRLVYRIGSNQIEIVTVFESHRQMRKSEINID